MSGDGNIEASFQTQAQVKVLTLSWRGYAHLQIAGSAAIGLEGP
jgi:hypothetical protein